MGWSRSLVWAEGCTGVVLESGQSTKQFSICSLCDDIGRKQVYICIFQEKSLFLASGKPHFKSTNGPCLPSVNSRDGLSNIGLKLLIREEGSLKLIFPFSSGSRTKSVGSNQVTSPLPPALCCSFFTVLVVDEPHC